MKTSAWKHRLSQLEEKWADGTITEEEAIEYTRWYNQDQEELVTIPYVFAASEDEHKLRMLLKLDRWIEKRKCLRRAKIAAAAIVLTVIGTGSLFYLSNQTHSVNATAQRSDKTDILPGKTKASLRLANGQVIPLDSAANGLIAQQGSVNVRMSAGELTYEKRAPETSMTYNTLYTHNGEQYSLTLSDGTRVWLNAASSLQFPVAFGGGERRVELSGEAYFDVAKDAGKPFFVHSATQEIKVLGTEFNVNAYGNEQSVETTLLNGKVQVNGSIVLLPGEQAQSTDGRTTVKKDVDLDATVAWKNGRFNFNDADISVIMREMERWYDIQVIFQGKMTNDRFYGTIPRNASFQQVLRILQNNRVHFELQGKRLTILP